MEYFCQYLSISCPESAGPCTWSQGRWTTVAPTLDWTAGGRLSWSRAARASIPLWPLARVYPDMFSLAMAHKALVDGEFADAAVRDRFDRNLRAFLSLAEAAKHYPCIRRAWVEFLGEAPDPAVDREDPIPA